MHRIDTLTNLLSPWSAAAPPELVLVGDCGGTNTRLRLFEIGKGDECQPCGKPPGRLIKECQYVNEAHESFGAIVKAFFAMEPRTEQTPRAGCLAVAGPVELNRVGFTNRNWVIDGHSLESELGIERVRLINDFVANGYGLLTLDHAKECVALQKAEAVDGAPIACIGAGTGLGECFSTSLGAGLPYDTYPSEGGHAEFAPRSPLEFELLQFLMQKFGQGHRVSVERVVSGTGLGNVYEFLRHKFPEKVNAQVDAEFEAADSMRGKVVAVHSLAGAQPHCTLCAQAMSIFAGAYGAEAGVSALKWIPLRGLYVAGGLTPKNIELIAQPDGPFLKAFHDKGRVSPLLRRIPLWAVLSEDIGQRGAHLVAFKQLELCWANESLPTDQRAKRLARHESQRAHISREYGMGCIGEKDAEATLDAADAAEPSSAHQEFALKLCSRLATAAAISVTSAALGAHFARRS